ncbi:hypothetical protein LCI18_014508 [Fusarium solani-melongenae]|uniref:Uncharacterized protein n=1 Tax=Fusarium solani subsp. cucurbitae TaxID=2747967 RepID=A0ACD3ZR68_FUSSC|nr:hypothetical protein LCI18_014508 [Fusarium solani-melongenae]
MGDGVSIPLLGVLGLLGVASCPMMETTCVCVCPQSSAVGTGLGVPCCELSWGDAVLGSDANTAFALLNKVELVTVADNAGLDRVGVFDPVPSGGGCGGHCKVRVALFEVLASFCDGRVLEDPKLVTIRYLGRIIGLAYFRKSSIEMSHAQEFTVLDGPWSSRHRRRFVTSVTKGSRAMADLERQRGSREQKNMVESSLEKTLKQSKRVKEDGGIHMDFSPCSIQTRRRLPVTRQRLSTLESYRPLSPTRLKDSSIIAVHGLSPPNKSAETHAWDTWQTPAGRLWLRDDLPKVLPEARIFLYAYDSTVVYGKDITTFLDNADAFLEAIRKERRETPRKPLLLLGHSLGGLLVSQALINATYDERYQDIARATQGFTFFATPHNHPISNFAMRIAFNLGFQKGDKVLETLANGSIFGGLVHGQQESLHGQYPIVVFWGVLDRIVPLGALLGPERYTDVVVIQADHYNVCRFGGSMQDRDNLKIVLAHIEDLYDKAIGKKLVAAQMEGLKLDYSLAQSSGQPTESAADWVPHILPHMAEVLDGSPEEWRNILKLVPETIQADLEPREEHSPGCIPIWIAGAPVVIPAPDISSMILPLGCPDDPYTHPIDPSDPVTDQMICDIFDAFPQAGGFYLLLGGHLQIIVPDDFDYQQAMSEDPPTFGKLRVSYVYMTLLPTAPPTASVGGEITLRRNCHDVSIAELENGVDAQHPFRSRLRWMTPKEWEGLLSTNTRLNILEPGPSSAESIKSYQPSDASAIGVGIMRRKRRDLIPNDVLADRWAAEVSRMVLYRTDNDDVGKALSMSGVAIIAKSPGEDN